MSDRFKISENIYDKSPEKGPIKFKIARWYFNVNITIKHLYAVKPSMDKIW